MKHIVTLFVIVCAVFLNTDITSARQHNNVVKKEHFTLDSCAKSCLEENNINCKYFKFVNATGTCYLSSKDHPDFSSFERAKIKVSPVKVKPKVKPKPKPKPNTKPNTTAHSIDDLKNYQAIKNKLGQLKDIKDDLKVLKAVVDSGRSRKLIAGLSRRTQNQQFSLNNHKKVIKWLSSRVKPINKAFAEIRQYQRAVKKQLVNLKKIGNVNQKNQRNFKSNDNRFSKAIKNLWATNSRFRQRMNKFHKSNKRLWQRVENIRNTLAAKTKPMGEKQLLKLTGALSLVNKRQQSIQSKISRIEGAINRITKVNEQNTGTNSHADVQIKDLKSTISILKDDLRKISRPLVQGIGRQNAKISKMSSDVQRMRDAQNDFTSDLKDTKHHVASVVRDLADVQVASQAFQSRLEDVKLKTNSIIHDVRILARDQGDLPSIINMAKMEAKLFKSLELIHQKEVDITENVIHFKSTLNSLMARMVYQEKSTSAINVKLGQIESAMSAMHRAIYRMGRQMRRMVWTQKKVGQTPIPVVMRNMATREKKLLKQTWYLRNKMNRIAKLANSLAAQQKKEHKKDLQQMKRLQWQIKSLRQRQSKIHKVKKLNWQRYQNRKRNKQKMLAKRKWKKNKLKTRKYKANARRHRNKSKQLKKKYEKME